ncbi:MAG: chromosome segregation protein SMC [Armatimonadetes bacterium]|nr:chromosome segregation protein SMC [Armatimonadota bacterium]
MITRIEAKGYKCLRDVDVQLGPFNVLVGPNASGKSTLLDVLGFLRDALGLDGDLGRAISLRARSVAELTWKEGGGTLLLVVSASGPSVERDAAARQTLRYVCEVGSGPGLEVEEEWLLLLEDGLAALPVEQVIASIDGGLALRHMAGRTMVPSGKPVILLLGGGAEGGKYVPREGLPWSYRTPPSRCALSLVPEDPEQFAEAVWLRNFLRDHIHTVELSPSAMRATCPPYAPREYQGDGSNLPLLVQQIEGTERFDWWIEHLALVMHGLKTVEVVEQEHDRHLYLVAVYEDGLRVPAWRLSDGTLRFMALNLIAYLPPEDRVYIIEEPENGIHPRALDYLIQSLTSVYEGQVFLATHSPIIVGLTDPENLLCFQQDEEGATQIIRGSEHPELQAWKEAMPLGDLFAAGILG